MVKLGLLGKPFGYKGEMHFYPYNLKTQSLIIGQEFVLQNKTGPVAKITLETCRAQKDNFILKFKEFDSKEGVAQITNATLALERKHLPVLPDGEYYLEDLLGCSVLDFTTEQVMGVVEQFSFNHADQTILHVRSELYPQLEVLVHPFVKKVDLAHRRCYIIIPDYED